MSVGNVHKIRKRYLINANYSNGRRPWLLNKEMAWSFVLWVTKGRVTIALDVARHVEHDFGILVNAQTVRHAFQSGLSSQ